MVVITYMSGWHFEVRGVSRPRGESNKACSFSRLNSLSLDRWKDLPYVQKIRLTVREKQGISRLPIPHILAPAAGEAKSKVPCFLSGRF